MTRPKLKRCTKEQRLCISNTQDWCNIKSHLGYRCTRRLQHKGNHVACFGDPYNHNSTMHNMAVWRNVE